MKRARFAAAALALAALFAPPASAQDEGALAWARAEVKRAPPPDDVESLYWPSRGAPLVVRPCRTKCKRSWHLAARPLPADELAKRPIYKVTQVPARVAKPGAAEGEGERPEAAALYDINEVVQRYPTAVPASGGVAQSRDASELAGDALQAVGQVVVNKASRAALERARDKIAEGLRCPPRARPGGATGFPRTCAVVGALRLQDLGRRGRVLFDALFRDALEQATADLPGEARSSLEPLTSVLVPEASRLLGGRPGRGAEVVAQRLVEAAMADLKRVGVRERLSTSPGAPRGRAAVALAALANAQCTLRAASPGALLSFAQCPIDDYVRRAAFEASIDDAAVLTRAHELARLLLDAMTLGKGEAGGFRERAGSAASAAFVAACSNLDASPALAGCPPSHEPGRAPSALGRLALARFLTEAALDGDPNALIVGAVAASDAAPGGGDARARRALRLLGGLLQYTASYEEGGPEGHERRVRLLEDVSDEMSSRDERVGDAVWSLGGSLRLSGGARLSVDSKRTAFYGPLNLPLGLGLQTVAANGVGLHLEVSAFDLGQYISFEEGGRVREPEFADALAPSLTVGAAFGKNVPFVVGPTVGYSPQFAFSNDKRGAINFGLALGLYVPIFDLN